MSDTKPTNSDQKPKKSSIALAIENNPCALCRTMGYPTCKGHGGSGGGGSSSSSNSNESKHENNKSSMQATNAPIQTTVIEQVFNEAKTNGVLALLNNDVIRYDAGLLSVEGDKLRGMLTFKMKAGLSQQDIDSAHLFFKAIKKEFDEFKNELTEKGVSTSHFSAILQDNVLTIHIPNPKYYDAFIKQLERSHLLPIANPEQKEKTEKTQSVKEGEPRSPTPFSTRLER